MSRASARGAFVASLSVVHAEWLRPGDTAPLIARVDTATSVFAGCSGTDTTCSVVIAGHMVVTATFNLKP